MLIETPSSIFRKAQKVRDSLATEGLFRQYIEATPLGILVVDHEGTLTYVNDSLCRLFGYRPEELLGQPIEILVPDADQARHIELRDGYLADPAQRLLQGRNIRGRRKDGGEIAVAIGLNPLIQGPSVSVVCTILDQSSSRRAEDTLANFFELSLDLFCIANTEGYFLRVNPNFPRLLGCCEQELLNRPFLDFVHPDDLASTREAMAVLTSGQPVVRFRNRYRTVQGSYLWLEWSARVVSSDGIIYAVARDITADLRTQELQGQLKLATEFQQKLYPLCTPTVEGLDLSGSAVSATHLCGDYFDYIVTREGRVVIAVGDVSGHGLGPALAMVQVRSILRGLLDYRSQSKLSKIIRKLNQLLLEDLPEARFVSLFLIEIDTLRRQLHYVGAGHQALLFRADGRVETLKSTSPVLGLLKSIDFDEAPSVRVVPGDVIFICTDGVTEARNDRHELFGIRRASDCVAKHIQAASSEIIQQLFAQVNEFSRGKRLDDDMTAVVAKLLPK